jgi:hypothetical protein
VIIDSVDSHIATQLGKVKLFAGGQLTAVTVYSPGDSRPKGETKLPCYVISRYSPFTFQLEDARPGVDQWWQSLTTTVAPQEWKMGGGEESGPDSWSKKPYPTPISLWYQIDMYSATSAHDNQLLQALLEVLPLGYMPEIDGHHVLFHPEGNPVDLSDLGAPSYRKAVRYGVYDVLIPRGKTTAVPSIVTLDYNTQTRVDNIVEDEP